MSFRNAYTPNKPMIPQRNIINNGNLIDNNVKPIAVTETINEYMLHVDSSDRDINIYPNPYSFSTYLGGSSKTVVNKIKNKNGTVSEVVYGGNPSPCIDLNFKNIKYFRIKYVMLPRYINYDMTYDISDNRTYVTASVDSTILSNYRYLILKIKEINTNLFSSDNEKKDTFIIYRDTDIDNAVSDYWFATQPIKFFYDNELKSLSKFTVQILTPEGEELRLKYDHNTINIPFDEINIDKSTASPSSDFYKYFNNHIQMSLELDIGVCENQIDVQKSYR